MKCFFELSLVSCCFLVAAIQPSEVSAEILTNPFFSLEFDEFLPGEGGVHTDTHKIVLGKPVKTLTLSMISSGDPVEGDQHQPGSEILLDLSDAIVHDYTNSSSELSISLTYLTPLPTGEYPATKVIFGFSGDFFHGTIGSASGTFSDGESFEVEVFAGFIPEPTSLLLSLVGASFLLPRKLLRCDQR